MDPGEVKVLRAKPWFTTAAVAEALGVKRASARVAVSRWQRRGLLYSLKNDFHVYAADWAGRTTEDRFRIAAFLRVPSYVSLLTALSWHGITTQVQRGVVECVTLRRPSRHEAGEVEFRYYKTSEALFGGFAQTDGYFMATPEKAFVDAVHLYRYGKYALDVAALSLDKLDRKRLKAAFRPYPEPTAVAVRGICRT